MMNKKIGAGIEMVLMIVSFFAFGYFLSFDVEFVSAEEAGCCSLADSGEQCATTSADVCAETFAEGSLCTDTSFCQKGCCFDEDSGIYDKNVLKEDCSAEWVRDPNCNMPAADLGCCVLGSSSSYETAGQCRTDSEVLALNNGTMDWRGDVNEAGCFILGASQEKGACVIAGGDCKFIGEASCLGYEGDFYEGLLCTSLSVGSNCKMTQQTQCVDGKDGVYFIDSCGNVANIYDSSLATNPTYWDRVVSGTEVCGSGDVEKGNANSPSCGNCDRFAGGICASASEDGKSVDIGDFYCRDMSCEFDGENYKNGESWCVYDGAIGDGDDVVGSRHWKYVCSQGKVQVEPCADMRNEICVQTDSYEADGVEVDFRTSQCVDNNWGECLNLNTDSDSTVGDCNAATDCVSRHIGINDFMFDACVPEYPEGFDWTNDRSIQNAEEICSMGTQTCTVVYAKNWKFQWECEQNCDCEGPGFVNQMQELCRGLGDCGGYVNTAGEYTDGGYGVSRGVLKISDSLISLYKTKNEVVEGQVARPDNYSLGGAGLLMSILQGDEYNAHDSLQDDDAGLALAAGTGGMLNAGGLYIALRGAGIDEDKAKWLDFGGYLIYDFLFGDVDKRPITFTCEPWSPPVGGDNCESCNDDPLKPCSEYRCGSLGAGCELENIGSDQEMCSSSFNDGLPPVISPILDVLSDGELYTDESASGFRLSSADGGCLEAYDDLVFGIETDDLAHCKYDIEAKDFEQMSFDFEGGNYVRNHTTSFSLPDPSHGQSQGYDWNGELSLFVKCQDRFGILSNGLYQIDMCVYQGPDISAPRIISVSPDTDKLVKFDVTNLDFEVVTNELSTCRWSSTDVSYSLMENNMSCEDSFGVPSNVRGYSCTDNLALTGNDNNYYIRCEDQPWANESDRNFNMESYPYNLKKPESRIAINSIEPSQDFESDTDITTIDLRVSTSGGGDSHLCSYSLSGYDRLIEMLETGENSHSQPLERPIGEHEIFVECTDETGDSVQNSTVFEITAEADGDGDGDDGDVDDGDVDDEITPEIARIWQTGNRLYIYTNNDMMCRTSYDSCDFSWGDGVNLGDRERHTISIVHGRTYYVRCLEEVEVGSSGCSVVVKAL